MNYLSMLRVELWTEIILLAAPFINVPPDPATHLSIFRKSSHRSDKAKKIQIFRLGLLHVCQTFYSLVEPLLYKELALSGERQVQCLREIVNTKRIRDQPCFKLTKSLFIYPEAISTLKGQAPICDIFPNLITMVAYEDNQRLFWMWTLRMDLEY